MPERIALFMVIGNERVSRTYKLSRLGPESPGWLLSYDSDAGETVYSVRVDKDQPHCTCEDSQYRGRKACKHIRGLISLGLI
jgi:hypothetical protein